MIVIKAPHNGAMASDPLELSGRGCPRSLHCRVLQSPLAGVSDRVFRSLGRRWSDLALLFTEMVNATSLELGHGRAKVEELGTETGPIGVQLFDYRPEAMAEAARRAEAAGAFLIGGAVLGCTLLSSRFVGTPLRCSHCGASALGASSGCCVRLCSGGRARPTPPHRRIA